MMMMIVTIVRIRDEIDQCLSICLQGRDEATSTKPVCV